MRASKLYNLVPSAIKFSTLEKSQAKTRLNSGIRWECLSFHQIHKETLYELMALRTDVFVVEQKCAYQELDGRDLNALHVLGFDGNQIVAYARILPPGSKYNEVSIGRVLTKITHRKLGIGRILMNQSFEFLRTTYGEVPVRIEAQVYLEQFYQSLGFKTVSDEYLEDGIPHYEMHFASWK